MVSARKLKSIINFKEQNALVCALNAVSFFCSRRSDPAFPFFRSQFYFLVCNPECLEKECLYHRGRESRKGCKKRKKNRGRKSEI